MSDQKVFRGVAEKWSRVALGCSRVGSFGNQAPRSQILRTFELALDMGVNVFDTANIYGQGDSEREIGRLLSKAGKRPFVVTKVGQQFSKKMEYVRPLKPVIKALLGLAPSSKNRIVRQRQSNIGYDLAPEAVRENIEKSRRRLRQDVLDGVLLHSPPATEIERSGVWDTMLTLRAQGKIRHLGVSCDDMATLRLALSLQGVEIVQISLGVYDQADAEGMIDQICDGNIAIMLREVIKDQPTFMPRDAVHAVTLRPGVSTVIVGTTNPDHLFDFKASI